MPTYSTGNCRLCYVCGLTDESIHSATVYLLHEGLILISLPSVEITALLPIIAGYQLSPDKIQIDIT